MSIFPSLGPVIAAMGRFHRGKGVAELQRNRLLSLAECTIFHSRNDRLAATSVHLLCLPLMWSHHCVTIIGCCEYRSGVGCSCSVLVVMCLLVRQWDSSIILQCQQFVCLLQKPLQHIALDLLYTHALTAEPRSSRLSALSGVIVRLAFQLNDTEWQWLV